MLRGMSDDLLEPSRYIELSNNAPCRKSSLLPPQKRGCQEIACFCIQNRRISVMTPPGRMLGLLNGKFDEDVTQ